MRRLAVHRQIFCPARVFAGSEDPGDLIAAACCNPHRAPLLCPTYR